MKRKFLKFWFSHCLFLVKLWYTLTMILTYKRGVKVETNFNSYQEIAYELAFGMRYKKDLLRETLDVMIHPTRIQDRINKNQLIGDCEDHAGYWVATLLKTKLVKNAWLGFTMFGDANDSIQGHAVCVFEDWAGEMFWVDYNKPNKFSNFPNVRTWDWCEQVCKAFSSEDDTLNPISAGMFKIEKLSNKDRPIFGEITHKVW